MTEYDFTLEGFRAWLTSHPQDDVAGQTCSDWSCPGYEFWVQYMESIEENPDDHSFVDWRESTDWLEQFASTLDGRYGEPSAPNKMIQPVTYGQCLDVLDTLSTEVLIGPGHESGPMTHSAVL